jgi:tetratricopeptide (TPR) repeat protein
VATHNLASVALQLGLTENARLRFEEALALFRKIGDRSNCSLSLGDLSMVNVRLGRVQEASAQLAEALAIVEGLAAKREGANALAAAAELALALDRPREASRWFGASEALRALIGSPPAPYEKADLARLMTRMREALGEGGLGTGLAEGGAWTFEEAIGNVRAWLSSVPTNN